MRTKESKAELEWDLYLHQAWAPTRPRSLPAPAPRRLQRTGQQGTPKAPSMTTRHTSLIPPPASSVNSWNDSEVGTTNTSNRQALCQSKFPGLRGLNRAPSIIICTPLSSSHALHPQRCCCCSDAISSLQKDPKPAEIPTALSFYSTGNLCFVVIFIVYRSCCLHPLFTSQHLFFWSSSGQDFLTRWYSRFGGGGRRKLC